MMATTAAAVRSALATDASGWRSHLTMLVGGAAALLLLFGRDAADMATIWWESSTYGHCLFILPIIGWLVAQRLPELRRIVPCTSALGLPIVAAGALGWLLGEAAGVALARHLGLVLMLQGLVVACLGTAVARGLLFPLCYALFMVPAGEELVPPLQTLTAKMCMALLALVGVPAHIDGVFITIPNGYFEVAEACSGVKFLIAMVAYGALAANVCFRSWRRRAIFMAAAIAAPVVSNGLRAWGTIYVAHLTDSRFAAGFDHVVYGWVFFAVVLGALMAASWPAFDRGPNDPWIDAAALQPHPPAPEPARKAMRIGAAALALAAAPLAWSAAVAASGQAKLAERIAPPEVPGWQAVAAEPDAWRPHFAGADRTKLARYRDRRGRTVDLAIILYASQSEGRELVGFGQGAISPDGAWAWANDTAPPPGGRAFRISAPGPVVREVATFYRVGDVTTGNEMRVKLETLKVRLLGGPQRAAAVLVSAEAAGTGSSARPAIDDFLRALGPIDRLVARASGG